MVIAEGVCFSTMNLWLVLLELRVLCLTDEGLSAFPGEDLPPSSRGDVWELTEGQTDGDVSESGAETACSLLSFWSLDI